MKYRIDTNSNLAAYLQLYRQIKRDVVDGIYKAGQRLPSKRLLAEETGVSVITVEHALRLLCDEGYAEARERSGCFVIYKHSDFVSTEEPKRSIAPATPNYTHLTSDFPFSVLSKTMRRVIADQGKRLLVRSPSHGCTELREAICRYLARSNGVTARPEQIIIGSGAEHLYSLIAQLIGNGRPFAIEDPSYEKIRRVYTACGTSVEPLPLAADGIKSEALAASNAGVLHVTPFNSYPSGVTATASKRREYLRFASERNAVIVEDDYSSELTVSTKNEDTLFSLSENGSVIYMNTFSRTVSPSVRVGYAVLPERLLPVFEDKLGFYSCTVPVFEQLLLTELIESGDFERHINRVRRALRKQK